MTHVVCTRRSRSTRVTAVVCLDPAFGVSVCETRQLTRASAASTDSTLMLSMVTSSSRISLNAFLRLSTSIDGWTLDSARVGAPYLVDRDGTVYQTFDDAEWIYHLGIPGTNGYYDRTSVAIEFANELGLQLEVEETGRTFRENADLKARAYQAATGLTCLAEDSGFEVDALDGAPGIHERFSR